MIGTWIWIIIVFIGAVIGIVCFNLYAPRKKYKLIGIAATSLVAVLIIGGSLWFLYGTATGQRSVKSFKSNVGGGLYREVIVYDITGEEIARYTGQFDVDYNSERIIFDNEYGKRHVIYYTTSTVIINEIEPDKGE